MGAADWGDVVSRHAVVSPDQAHTTGAGGSARGKWRWPGPRLRRGGTVRSWPSGQAGREHGQRADDGAGGLVGRRGCRLVAGHEVLQGDVAAAQRLERLEPLGEPLAGGEALEDPGG